MSLAIPQYTALHEWILLNEVVAAVTDHRGHFRKGCSPYYKQFLQLKNSGDEKDGKDPYHRHLFGTAMNSVLDQALTGVPQMAACFHHDTPEDIEGKKASDLVNLNTYGVKESDLPPDLKDIRLKVINAVDGVTKIRGHTKEATAGATFLKLLATMRNCGIRSGNVKLCDRTDNVATIDALFNPDSRINVMRQTEEVYVMLARILQVRQSVMRLVDYCVQFGNPQFFEDFSRLEKERLAVSLAPVVKNLLETILIPNPTNSAEKNRFLERHIARIELNERPLADFTVTGVPFRDLTVDQLDISPDEPLFEVTVVTNPSASAHRIASYITENFPGVSHDEKTVSREGMILEIDSRVCDCTLVFRIVDCVAEARLKRGRMAGFIDSVPPDMSPKITKVLALASSDPSKAIPVAKEILLHPTISVYTPHDTRMVELPSESTGLDFAAEIHGDFLVGLQRILCARKTSRRKMEFVPQGIFDELPDGAVVKLETCLVKGNPDPSKIKTDPGATVFCKTDKAKEMLVRQHLRYDSLQKGRRFVTKLADLFGLAEDKILGVLREKLSRKAINDERLLSDIGRGEYCGDLLNLIGELLSSDPNNLAWTVIVSMPDDPGELHNFTAELARQKINIDRVRDEPSLPTEAGLRSKVLFVVSDRQGTKSIFDMIKIFLKLSYDHKLSVKPVSISWVQDKDLSQIRPISLVPRS